MTTGDIPDRFVWTKIQADAGQSVDRILRRKELERQLGGTFWWGIGQAPVAEKISQLGPDPDVILSLMRSQRPGIRREVLKWHCFSRRRAGPWASSASAPLQTVTQRDFYHKLHLILS
jgi:hypothetical protein